MELDITMISSILTISLGLDELQSFETMTFSNAAAISVNLSGLKVDLSSGLNFFLVFLQVLYVFSLCYQSHHV